MESEMIYMKINIEKDVCDECIGTPDKREDAVCKCEHCGKDLCMYHRREVELRVSVRRMRKAFCKDCINKLEFDIRVIEKNE